MPFEDLVNEGVYGLLVSIPKYDLSKNYRFITYSSYWIKQAILKALGEHSRTIRLPMNKVNKQRELRNIEEELMWKLERAPTYEELEEVSNMDTETIDNLKVKTFAFSEMSNAHIMDIKETLSSGEDITEAFDKESLMDTVEDILKCSSVRNREILFKCFGVNGYRKHTLKELSVEYDISKERVRQIKEGTLRKLRKEKGELRSYL